MNTYEKVGMFKKKIDSEDAAAFEASMALCRE